MTCCERCGFEPEHTCQLDLDHIDGNHSNDSPDNIQTLCANCHRLKTHTNGDTLTPSNGSTINVLQSDMFVEGGVGG